MPTSKSYSTVVSIDRIRQGINDLTLRQAKVLDRATYVGMTIVEERAFVARGRLIARLVQELHALEAA